MSIRSFTFFTMKFIDRVQLIAGTTLALALLTGCQTEPAGHSSTPLRHITLEREQTFGGEEVLLSEIRSLAIDANSNVYLLDVAGSQSQLVSYASDGSLRWSHTASGDGPGDLDRPWRIAVAADTALIVLNQSRTRFDWFTLDGQYLEGRQVRDFGFERISFHGILPDGRLLCSDTIWGVFGIKVVVVDPATWAVTDTFSVIQNDDPSISSMVSFSPVLGPSKAGIAMGHVGEYRYDMYLTSAQGSQRLARSGVSLALPAVVDVGNGGVSIRGYSRMYPLVHLDDHLVMGGAWWPLDLKDPVAHFKQYMQGEAPELDYANDLDVFDLRTNAHVASVDAAALGIDRLLGADAQGRIYVLLAGDEPTIARFRVLLTDLAE